jgi:hypothetical protein
LLILEERLVRYLSAHFTERAKDWEGRRSSISGIKNTATYFKSVLLTEAFFYSK